MHYFCLLLLACAIAIAQIPQDVIKAGEAQYQLLQERSNLPQYGSCWKQALQHVHQGCNSLSEDVQADMALKLTNCFLDMSGHEEYHCESDRKQNLRKICISNMSDRAFNVYTEFYTHTQNICWFLRGQIWQEILVERTYEVGKQLEASAENQEKLLGVQKESLAVQERSLKYGQDLKEIIETVKNNIANSQETILGIQKWLISETSWFDTVLFYIMSLSFVFIFTSMRSSNASRLPVLVLLFGGLLSERFICQLFLAFNRNERVDSSHESLMVFVWFFRYTLVTVCMITIVFAICFYKDYAKINNRLLVEIYQQNDRLLDLLENKKELKDKPKNIDVVHENEIQKQSGVFDKSLEDKEKAANKLVGKNMEYEQRKNNGMVHSPAASRNVRKPPCKTPEIGDLKKYNLRDRRGTPDIT